MKKVILFDFWGTLVENGVESPIKQVKYLLRIHLPFSEYVIRMEKAMMTQSFPTLKDAFRSICTEFSINPPEHVLDDLVGMWNKAWLLAEPYPETIEILEKLQQSHQLVLVSNTDAVSIKKTIEKFGLEKYFHTLFLSFEQGMIKTDPAFMNHVLKTLNVQPSECLMIGDSLQSDIVAAEKAGIDAILIDRRNGREYPKKIHDLRELLPLLEQ